MDHKLYIKLFLSFLLIFASIGFIYIYVTSNNAQAYFDEVNQRLHKELANHTVQEVTPLVNGEIDKEAIHDIMHSMMVINPSVEVYLLNETGEIYTYVAPKKKIKVDRVPIEPIIDFINSDQSTVLRGLDPRHPDQSKVFSAAPIYSESQEIEGYIYIILASEEQTSVMSTLFDSYVLNAGLRVFFIALGCALLIGLLAIWFLTKNLRTISKTVEAFQSGNLNARIKEEDKGDFRMLATSINSMTNQISSHIDEIKKVDTLRKELIANISHDLRTPLSIISGYVETLIIKEELTIEERRKYLNRILLSVSNLSKLIEQLFEYSKLEAQEIKPEKQAFNIKDLAFDLIAKFEGLAKEKQIRIATDIPRSLPLVYADLAMVDRAISNLIDNAIKYTNDGDIVEIKMFEVDDEVQISVNDTGPGIPIQEQANIFQRFKQYEGSATKKGAGLGLAIVKKILEIHEKTIGIHSEPGKGTSFYFNLPAYS